MEKAKLKRIISDLVFIGLLAVMLFVVFRYDLRYVETGSMEPEIHVGALCVIDPRAYDDILPEVGDIAMYETSTRFVIHRIIRVDDSGYVFKGDNNLSEDYNAIPVSHICGKVVHTINFVSPLIRSIRHLS